MSDLPRFILGIDPGRKSGVAILDLMLETCEGWEVTWPEYGYLIEDCIKEWRPAVVAESFIINANTIKNTQAPWSLEGIGVARHLAHKYGCDFDLQPPSSAKRFATNDRLQALGWYKPGKGHLADAQRHTLLYVTRHGWWHDALGNS
jgi:hypothetical protein